MSWNRALLMYKKHGHPEWSGIDSCKLFMSSLLPQFMESKVSIDEAKLDAAEGVHGDDYEAMLKEVMEDHGREYMVCTGAGSPWWSDTWVALTYIWPVLLCCKGTR